MFVFYKIYFICLYFIGKYKNNSLTIKETTGVRYLKNIFKEEKYIIAVSSIDKVVHL